MISKTTSLIYEWNLWIHFNFVPSHIMLLRGIKNWIKMKWNSNIIITDFKLNPKLKDIEDKIEMNAFFQTDSYCIQCLSSDQMHGSYTNQMTHMQWFSSSISFFYLFLSLDHCLSVYLSLSTSDTFNSIRIISVKLRQIIK